MCFLKYEHFLFNFDLTESSKNLKTHSQRCGCWSSVVIRGGGNRRTRGKPPTLEGRPPPCHMLTLGLDAISKARMLAFCGHTWWRKLKNPGKTTDLGRATTTLPHADTGIQSRVAAVASKCVNHCTIQAPYVCNINPQNFNSSLTNIVVNFEPPAPGYRYTHDLGILIGELIVYAGT